MKITYVTQYYPPHTGGLELVAKKQAESAVSYGHDVSVVTYRVKDEVVGIKNENGVKVTRARGFHFFDTYFGIPFCFPSLGMISAIQKAVKNSDIVHVHDVFYITSWVTSFFSALHKKPLVVTQHVAMVKHTSVFVMGIQNFVYHTFGKSIFNVSTSIIVYNEIVKSFLMQKMGVSPEKILQVRNGIDIEKYFPVNEEKRRGLQKKLGLPQDKPLVLFVGRFVPKKGYKELFNARSEVFNIAFVGSGSVPKEWYEEKGVFVLGERSQEEIAEIYNSADIFVAPTQGEIFTLVMQEAFASGLPVITTEEEEYSKYDIDKSKIVFCKPESDVLREEITKLVAKPNLRKEMSIYSRVLAEKMFDWKKNVQPTIDMYTQIITNKSKVLVTTSWDDGNALDMRVAKLLKKYGIKGTFYVAPQNSEFTIGDLLTEEQIVELSKEFEIGAHTITHRILTDITLDEVKKEVEASKKYLEALLKKPIPSFCYPRGKYSKEISEVVKKAGFSYARTVKSFVTKLDTSNPYAMHTSIDTYDHWTDIWRVAVFVRFNPFVFFTYYRKWDEIAKEMFTRVRRQGGVFHLWGHSWQIEEHGDWKRLEDVFKYISGYDDVIYVENSKIYE